MRDNLGIARVRTLNTIPINLHKSHMRINGGQNITGIGKARFDERMP